MEWPPTCKTLLALTPPAPRSLLGSRDPALSLDCVSVSTGEQPLPELSFCEHLRKGCGIGDYYKSCGSPALIGFR